MSSSYNTGNLNGKKIYFKRIVEESPRAWSMVFLLDIHLALTSTMAMLACGLRKYYKAELEGMQIPNWPYTF